MSRAVVLLHGARDRQRAHALIEQAPAGSWVEVRHSKRSLPQNARMWAMLTDVARQREWHGQKLPASDWKVIFTAALRRELRMVPNLTGDGMVLLGERTSEMTKAEMGDLMELIAAWGSANGIEFSEPGQPKAAIAEAAA